MLFWWFGDCAPGALLAFIIPGEGGESAGRWTHSAASQAPADLGAVCTVL